MGSAGYYVIGLLLIVIGVLAWLRIQPGARDSMPAGEAIHLLVTAAEQMLPGYTGEKKLAWVEAELAKFGLDVDPQVARLMIESAVYFLKQTKAQPVKEPAQLLPAELVVGKAATPGATNPNSPSSPLLKA